MRIIPVFIPYTYKNEKNSHSSLYSVAFAFCPCMMQQQKQGANRRHHHYGLYRYVS